MTSTQPGKLTLSLAQRHYLIALLLFGAVAMIFVLTATTGPVNTDVKANTLTAWQLAQTGEPWMEGLDITEYGEVSHYAVNPDGHQVTTRTPGQIWAAVPFYLASGDDQVDFAVLNGNIAAALMTALAVALMYLSLLRGVSAPASLGITSVFAFATPIWSVSADQLWTHPVTVLGCAGAAWALSRRRWALAGAFLGVAILGRVHLALIALVVGVGLSISRRSLKPMVQIGSTSGLGLLLLIVWNRYVFGAWTIQSGYSKEITAVIPGASDGLLTYFADVAGFLVSPDRGLLVWSPVLLLLMPAVIRGWLSAPDWSRWLAGGGVLYTAIQMALVRDFGGGDGFYGYRYPLELVTCLVPLVAYTVSHAGLQARRLLPVVLGYMYAVISIGAVLSWLWVPYTDAWTDSSLFVAVRDYPIMTPIWWALVGSLTGGAWYWATLLRWPSATGVSIDPEPQAVRTYPAAPDVSSLVRQTRSEPPT